MTQKVVFAELWHGGELFVEERWIDSANGQQETRYSFPGGKVKDGETEEQAMVSKIHAELGIEIKPEWLDEPEQIDQGDVSGYGFKLLLPFAQKLGDGSIIVWDLVDLLTHKQKGKLMPLTEEYVERNF